MRNAIAAIGLALCASIAASGQGHPERAAAIALSCKAAAAAELRKAPCSANDIYYLYDLRAVYELNKDEREDARAAILGQVKARNCRLPEDLAAFVIKVRAPLPAEERQ